MCADIDDLVLSGKLFNGTGTSRSSSPERSPSPDAGWHDDELVSPNDLRTGMAVGDGQSIGMGTGRTGVKGVIRDREEVREMNRVRREREVEEVNRRMERVSVGGEREEGDGDGEEKRDVVGNSMRRGRFGHLREVGVNGFVAAIEQEERGVWVVVHLYDSSLERCYELDKKLSQIARIHSDTKFLHARAAALGFASTPSSSSSRPRTRTIRSAKRLGDVDEDDPYADVDVDEQEDKDEDDEVESANEVDTDMLPTMLVYRDGELVHNWVRVDWEAGSAGIEEWLTKHRVLPDTFGASRSLGVWDDEDEDDEDDLVWTVDVNAL